MRHTREDCNRLAHEKGAYSKLTASLTEAVFPEANKHSYHLADKQFKPHLPVP